MRLWLLTITWAGQAWRFASSACVPLDGTAEVPHLGRLDCDDIEETADILTKVPEIRSVALRLLWPSPGVAYYIAQGHDLATAKAELSLWEEGDEYGDREVQIEGRLIEPAWGDLNEPVEATLEELAYTDLSTWPDASYVIDSTTWATAPAGAMGRSYPQIRGLPGHITGRTAIAMDIPGIMAPSVDTDIVLLSAGHILATSVLVGDSAGTTATIPVTYQYDGKQRICAVADISGTALTTGEEEYGVAFPSAGGQMSEDGRECQRAGDVLVARLAETRLRVDWAQVRSVAALLDWLVVVQADEAACSPWQWVQDHLLPLLPVSVVAGGRGFRLVPWRYDATAADARVRLVAGENCVAIGRMAQEGTESGAGLVNSCTVQFARNAATGALQEWVRVSGFEPDSERDHVSDRARASMLSLRSEDGADTGERPETIAADIVCSERAALQIALWRVYALAWARRTVAYRVHYDARLQLGDVVSLTDAGRYISDAPCLVCGRTVSPFDVQRVSLMVLR